MTFDTITWLSAFSSLLFLGIDELLLNIFNGFICFIMCLECGFFLVLNEHKNLLQLILYRGGGAFCIISRVVLER